jgi:hypothetical protein
MNCQQRSSGSGIDHENYEALKIIFLECLSQRKEQQWKNADAHRSRKESATGSLGTDHL